MFRFLTHLALVVIRDLSLLNRQETQEALRVLMITMEGVGCTKVVAFFLSTTISKSKHLRIRQELVATQGLEGDPLELWISPIEKAKTTLKKQEWATIKQGHLELSWQIQTGDRLSYKGHTN